MNPRRLTPSMSVLLAFEASARHLSFTRAAAELSLTQSAVSRQVQALEGLLEVPLFLRVGKRLELTAVGSGYLREVSASLQRIRNASLQAIAFRSGGGSIHLASLPTFASKWLLPRLNSFYARHPGILVHVHSRIGQFDLTQAGMDAAIGVGEGRWPGLIAHHLRDELLVPVMRPQPDEKFPRRPADLTQYLLLQVASRPDMWRRWFDHHGVNPHDMRLGPHFELTSHLIQAVAAGIGIGLVPSFLVEDELRSGVLVEALPAPFPTGDAYHLYVPPHPSAPMATLRDWLLELRDSAA